jgi:acyl carrier protein
MTLKPSRDSVNEQRLLAEITEILLKATGEDAQWGAILTTSSRLEGELGLDSLEVAALGDLLRDAYGERVDLPAFLAGLDIDQIIALTVGDLIGYVATALAVGE